MIAVSVVQSHCEDEEERLKLEPEPKLEPKARGVLVTCVCWCGCEEVEGWRLGAASRISVAVESERERG